MAIAPGTKAELRLGLVCYGGVSLAIYMHGMTKELHKLVVASRAYDDDPTRNPFADDDSCGAYYRALDDLAKAGRPLTVSIDVIAGTSAGGINGICLGKVLATNGSQDALKSLWIKEGDFKTLLASPVPLGGWRFRAVLSAMRILMHLRKRGVAPLKGALMSKLLFKAIGAMDEPVSTRTTLVQDGGSLDLYVTTTDLYGATVHVATGVGGVAQRETDHAQVVHFHADDLYDDFGKTAPLAFAARATSCFPGAFPPVSRQSFVKEVGKKLAKEVDVDAIAARFRNRYGKRPDGSYASDDAWFADGGILDNAPFDHVVRAIGEKSAETEVLRRLVYIEPDPGGSLDPTETDAPPKPQPGYADGVRRGALTVRGTHSFLRELTTLRDLNLRIESIGTIASSQMMQVSERIKEMWHQTRASIEGMEDTEVWDIDNGVHVEKLADCVYEGAEKFLGAGYQAYQRLKVEAATRVFADALTRRFVYPPESNRTTFVRAALSAWTSMRIGEGPLDKYKVDEVLGPVDVPYRERRLMFIVAGINDLYGVEGGPPRADLDTLKTEAWALLDLTRGAARAAVDAAAAEGRLDFLDIQEAAAFEDPKTFAEKENERLTALYTAYRADLDVRLKDTKARMWNAFKTITPSWPPEHRKALLSRFLGFPLWDGLIFPTISLSHLPQFSPIDVAQFSPRAAMALRTDGSKRLKGVTLHHFGAFADEQWRENDYLWGRLDAAELILRTLRETGTGAYDRIPRSLDEARAAAGPRLREALSAILLCEKDLLRDDLAKLPDEVKTIG
ncbi:MAG TPA: patatin-like protein [Frankiaceae bacterium]|jgi:patatin-related protein|nr:patatin-like protein [Frankiaceae bacterium]